MQNITPWLKRVVTCELWDRHGLWRTGTAFRWCFSLGAVTYLAVMAYFVGLPDAVSVLRCEDAFRKQSGMRLRMCLFKLLYSFR